MTCTQQQSKPTLVLGGTGKIGRGVVDRLTARGVPTRVGSLGRAAVRLLGGDKPPRRQ
jgi:uncharacterized protein YbjT (DUF2867 family)